MIIAAIFCFTQNFTVAFALTAIGFALGVAMMLVAGNKVAKEFCP
ncbi:hypothetical protein AAHB37_18525 [Glutamicibacter halophytocola]